MIEGTYLPPTCSMTEPSPVFVLASVDDRVLPPDGGFGPDAPGAAKGAGGYEPASVEATLARWAQLNGCSKVPQTESDPSGVDRTMYADCDDGVQVSATVAALGEHGWPAEATAQVLSFVRDQVRR
jgi:poly(3-hydroxybutyrate) depolymerase